MHIAEGVLSAPVLLSGAVIAIAGVTFGLKRLPIDRLMLAGLLGAAFFVASLIHVPIGFSSAHLILNGLVGVLLGISAFPVIFIALLLQAVLFQFGGLTVLGVNTATMGLGAVAASFLYQWIAHGQTQGIKVRIAAAVAGFSGVSVSSILTALALGLTDEGFTAAAWALLIANLPIMIVEAVITLLVISYIQRSYPQFLTTAKGF